MILFRTDGNKKIGSGHIMRCLSLAEAFRTIGEQCCFVVADDSFYTVIKQRGFAVEILGTDYFRMEYEIDSFIRLVEKIKPERIIIDSYYVTRNYLKALRRYCEIIYIDDLGAFAYPVNGLINYNMYGEDLDYASLYRKENVVLPKLFLGVKYAPLRESFRNVPKNFQPNVSRNVLISTGGADPIHLALECVEFLVDNQDTHDHFMFHFVLGAMNQDIDKIEKIARNCENIELHINVKKMEELMQKCDLAVGAAGSTLYELCACGIPTITYVLADNQIPGAQAFEKRNIMLSLGDLRNEKNAPKKIFDGIKYLSVRYEQRKEMSIKMQRLVDGMGANRLAKELLEK